MPKVLYFPYFGPNRRDDRRLVEVRIDFSADRGDPPAISDNRLREVLEAGEIVDRGQDPLFKDLAADGRLRFATLLGELAVLFQRQAGHPVDLIAVRPRETGDQWLLLVEYLHCDVGMTAIKLAVEVIQGQRSELAEPFARFVEFARQRLVPAETRAIMAAAEERNIPVFQLEQPPFSGARAGGYRVRPNGLLMLGHGSRAEILDGSFCLSRADDTSRQALTSAERRAAMLEQLGFSSPAEQDSPAREILACGTEMWLLPAGVAGGPPAVTAAEREQVVKVQQAVSGQAVLVRFGTGESGSADVLDFVLGPDLAVLEDATDPDAESSLPAAAGSLLDYLFPDPSDARIPLIAITGTNGKTTTSRMVDHILRHAGHHPGLVCTDGSYIGGKRITQNDESTIQGHGRVLTHRGIDSAVLETHHRGIAVRGFACRQTDVGICLNVTEEHIKQGEIESLEEMARVKRAVPERGRHAVLFADDGRCRGMIEHLAPERLWLVSLDRDVEALRTLAGARPFGACVLESIDGDDWLVLYPDGQRVELMPMCEIPAGFEGSARFNISNAMHAAVAAHVVGVPVSRIREALGSFEAGPELTPGRMNVFDQLPFRVVMDFAHTPDGIAKIAEFARRHQPDGRRILAFAGSQGREPAVWSSLGRAAAGHFDLYFCKEYPPRKDRPENQAAGFLKQGLEAEGVPAEQIRLGTYGQDQAFEIFDACQPGDLLVFLVGHTEMALLPGYIDAYMERLESG